MNKILSITFLLGATLTFASCANEEDDLFSQSAAERLNAASALYSSRLEAQPNGWAMQLYPTTKNEAPYGNGYLLLMDFNTDHSVKVAMNNSLTGNQFASDSSAWEVITDNGPVLTFNTYNKVMHTFSNPEDVASTGTAESENDETGTGIGGDYEFVIVDAPEDASYMMLKGKKRSTYNLLTPVEVGVNYADYLNDVKAFQSKMFPTNSPSYDVVHYGDSLYKMEGANDGIPNIYPMDSDAVLNESFNPFLITKRSSDYYLRFRDAKEFDNGIKIQEFKYMSDKDIFQSTENEAYYIDGDDPSRFFNEMLDSASTHRWQWNAQASMSDSYAALYSQVQAGFKAIKYTFNNMQIRPLTSSIIQVRVLYRTATGSNSTLNYDFTKTVDTDGTSLTYLAAETSGGEKVLTTIPALKSLFDAMSIKYTIVAGTTKFDLSTIKLVSATDANLWFVTTLY